MSPAAPTPTPCASLVLANTVAAVNRQPSPSVSVAIPPPAHDAPFVVAVVLAPATVYTSPAVRNLVVPSHHDEFCSRTAHSGLVTPLYICGPRTTRQRSLVVLA